MELKIIKKVMLCCIPILFLGCYKELTVQEFKQKFNWEEVEVEITEFKKSAANGSRDYVIEFDYNGQHYREFYTRKDLGYSQSLIGTKYRMLFNKDDPNEYYEYIILFDQSIKPINYKMIIPERVKLLKVWKYTNYCIVEYNYDWEGKGSEIRTEAIPLVYFDAFNWIKESKTDITIDCYVTELYENNKGFVIPYINIKKTLENTSNQELFKLTN